MSKELQQVTTTGESNSGQLCPNEPHRRLPVPVNITTSNQGKLAADSIIVSSLSTGNLPNPQSFTTRQTFPPMFQTKPTHPQLKVVLKPSCRQAEYDTYEGRLATYNDWPAKHHMSKEELARAGFYYTHYNDKVKCPYCYGGVYNWEPTDNAFSEHVRHNPSCEYMKYMTYHCLTTPVPEVRRKEPQKITNFEDIPAIKAVHSLGYSLETIRKVAGKPENYSQLDTNVLLENIFDIERKTGLSLSGHQGDDKNIDNDLEGAVGGLNLTEEDYEGMEDTDQEYQRLQDETEKLKNTKKCKKCQWRQADCLFLPCRHLVACEQCTKDINECLLCNEKIVGMTKVISGFQQSNDTATNSDDMETEENIYEPSTNNPAKATAFQQKIQKTDSEYERLKAEHQRLKNSTICNRCHQRPVDCLFLPCRHLATCQECAEEIEHCLQCNQEIIGTVKVFLP